MTVVVPGACSEAGTTAEYALTPLRQIPKKRSN